MANIPKFLQPKHYCEKFTNTPWKIIKFLLNETVCTRSWRMGKEKNTSNMAVNRELLLPLRNQQ
jgi:hypothetical protein